jgi:hypothetical protein
MRSLDKVIVFLFKKNAEEKREERKWEKRAREWKYHIQHEVPMEGTQIEFCYVRADIVEACAKYNRHS